MTLDYIDTLHLPSGAAALIGLDERENRVMMGEPEGVVGSHLKRKGKRSHTYKRRAIIRPANHVVRRWVIHHTTLHCENRQT